MDKCKSKELKNADACYDLNHHHFGDILRRCTGSKMRGLPATTAEIRQIIESSKVFMQTAVLVIDVRLIDLDGHGWGVLCMSPQ